MMQFNRGLEQMTFGEKVRTLREQHDWSQRELAKRSALASGTLSHLETGKFRGDLSTHQKLARGLGITLTELYRDVEQLDLGNGSASPVSPTSEQIETFRYNENARAVLLAKQIFQKPFLPQLLVLQPKGQTHVEQTPSGDKWVCLIKGQVDVQVGEAHHRLETPYESIFIKTSEPHQLTNVGEATAECIMVTSPVGV